jgi:hypothetical protein
MLSFASSRSLNSCRDTALKLWAQARLGNAPQSGFILIEQDQFHTKIGEVAHCRGANLIGCASNHGNCARCEEFCHVSLILCYLCGIIGPHGAMCQLFVRADTEDLLSMMIRGVRLVRPKDSAQQDTSPGSATGSA